MKTIFYVGIVIGILSRFLTLNIDRKQYPTEPNMLVSQIVLAIVASSLGALMIPALIKKSYTSITFLSLAAGQFRKVRQDKRKSLREMESMQLVQRGDAYIEEIALTYEVRNYTCIITSIITSGAYHMANIEFKLHEWPSVIIGAVFGIITAFIMKRAFRRDSIGDVADVIPAKINFDGAMLKVNDVVISNIGSKDAREIYLKHGLAVEVIPKDKSYINAGTILNAGQRQTIASIIYSRMGIRKDFDDLEFTPLPRRCSEKQSLVLAFIPVEKDIDKLMEAVKSTPILETAKGKNWALKKHTIGN